MKKAIAIILTGLLLSGCNLNYDQKINDASEKIFDEAILAEQLIDKYIKVWEKSRVYIEDVDMEKYTGMNNEDVNKYFNVNKRYIEPNFSANINGLKSYFEDQGLLANLTEMHNSIKDDIKELKNPPKKHEDAHDVILEMYDGSIELFEMSINPSGSYIEFTNRKKEAASKIIENKRKLEVIIPVDK